MNNRLGIPNQTYFQFIDAIVTFIDYYPHTSDTYGAVLLHFEIPPEDVINITVNQGPLTRSAWVRVFQSAITRYSYFGLTQRLSDAIQAANQMVFFRSFLKDHHLFILSPEQTPMDISSQPRLGMCASLFRRLTCSAPSNG